MPKQTNPKAVEVEVGQGPNVSQGAPPADEYEANVNAEQEGFERTAAGTPETDAGQEYGEEPSPIPALNAGKRLRESETVALPRSDAAYIQGAPTAAPQPTPSAAGITEQVLTAPAVDVATVDSFGLAGLARRFYGDTKYAIDIFEANQDTLVSPDSVVVGTVVRLPNVKKR